jgi:protocatechuate 3,4-dioxygenase beta subunit
VLPGRYRVSLNRLQQLYIKSVRWGLTDVTDTTFDLLSGVPANTQLSIVLGADAGELTGTVLNANSEPVADAVVTLLPSAEQRRSRSFFKTANTDSSGHFTFRGIAPGSYKVFAWDDADPNVVLYDAEFLRPYEGGGQNLEIQSNGKHTVELKLIVNKDRDDRSR